MIASRPLRILIPGGTGRLGLLLARHFYEQGHIVSAITRFPKPREWEAIHWDAETLDHWASSLEDADVVINLAGRSLRCRYTDAKKKAILHSRVRTTELIGQAIRGCNRPPPLWINASTVSIYPHAQVLAVDEAFDPCVDQAGGEHRSFAESMACEWEAAASSIPTPQTRRILLRLAPVMSTDPGGVFDSLLRLVRSGLGGEIGSGDQYVAWIHDFDFIRVIEYLIERDDLEGVVNATAPHPLPNHQFMCNLRRAWCTSYFGLSAPTWLAEMICFVIRTEPELVLKSRRVLPTKLLNAGFVFHFPEWRGACENLMDRWRAQNPG